MINDELSHVQSKKDYRQLVGTLFRKLSISYHLWFSHSEF